MTQNSHTQFSLTEEIEEGRLYLVITCQDTTVDWNIGYDKIIEECSYLERKIKQLGGDFSYSIDYGKEITFKLKLPMKDKETAQLYKEKFCQDLPRSINSWLNTYV